MHVRTQHTSILAFLICHSTTVHVAIDSLNVVRSPTYVVHGLVLFRSLQLTDRCFYRCRHLLAIVYMSCHVPTTCGHSTNG
uniref:Secreted protein n=1 Tax=Setaria viridis TaxID=4556 RepID=A0A4U6TSJ7_SETVI|nr:hypothetical protein SEVIR_7G200450v2 [Setaria viridis]